ncbi:MAG: TonB-dependent receptor domain-containing protein, partial [Cyclobacteriaceae bacterium]
NKKIEAVISDRPLELGTVTLKSAPKQLQEVVIEQEKIRQPVTTDLEGLNIRPDQTLSNVGGSVLDVLRNTPSINVDQDGNVSIRGSSGTNILLDGRNSALTSDLEQIPASAVKSIKIVNNPNAKYDAEGAGGVINIQLKKGEDKGTNVKVEGSLGTRLRTNGSIRINHRGDLFNIYGGYNYRNMPGVGYRKVTRIDYVDNEFLRQFADRERSDREHTMNFGGDYYFGKNKISYEGAVNFEEESDFESNQASLTNADSDELILSYVRQNTETEDNFSIDNALIYEYLFEKEDQEFRAYISHSFRDQLESQDIRSFTGATFAGERPTGRERSTNDEFNTTAVIQADYVHPFANGKLETGYKSTFRSLDNDFDYEVLNQTSDLWINQDTISNRFLYEEQVHALYAIYSTSLGKFDVALGTRVEQTLIDTKLFDTNEENEQNYLNFFPSFQSKYQLDQKNSFKFTYSRRIDRPNSWWLNPFPDVADSLTVRLGNSDLQPEFIHSLEFGHMINWENANITTNLFYRHVDGQVDYISRLQNGISFWQPTNLLTSQTYGLEIINTTTVTDWWSLNFGYSIFQIDVDGTNLDDDFSNNGLSWNAKFTTDFNLPFEIDLQLTGNYTAPEIEAQGRDLARYYLDVSLQRSFFDDKASFSVSFQDIFDTRNFRGENITREFRQEFTFKRESRIVMFNASWNI